MPSVKQVSRFSTGTWWWVRVLPPPGTLIWRFHGVYKTPPHGWCYPPYYGVGIMGPNFIHEPVCFARIDFKWLAWFSLRFGSDTGIRTRVSAVRGRRPRPLDDIAKERGHSSKDAPDPQLIIFPCPSLHLQLALRSGNNGLAFTLRGGCDCDTKQLAAKTVKAAASRSKRRGMP